MCEGGVELVVRGAEREGVMGGVRFTDVAFSWRGVSSS
jgi:hypothetical protein